MNYADYGYIRLAAIAPEVAIGNPARNAERVMASMQHENYSDVSLMLFPELCLSGYTCEDLFFNQSMIDQCREALHRVASASDQRLVVVGAPMRLFDGRLLNVGFVCQDGRVLGAVPKTSQPNYGEFYDKRWFVSGAGVEQQIDDPLLGEFTLSANQLFAIGESWFAVEICEDLWHPSPPCMSHVRAGAELIVNLSASNELVAKANYRRDLIRMASAQGMCAYLYASCGPTESTKDIVFGGHHLFAENGVLIEESDRFALHGSSIVTEFDWQKLRHDRARNSTFASSERPDAYRKLGERHTAQVQHLTRVFDQKPFVPDDEQEFDARANEILQIQSTGLARRMMVSGSDKLVLGVSGGLDSTLAFLVCLDALELLGKDCKDLCAITLPGPATSEHTLESARMLAASVQADLKEISINASVVQHLKDLSHGGEHDVVFENAQARERTQILFDLANQLHGIVVGTGDLSELALGWCTYNADQMSSYNVNASVPKTLVIYLVRWYAQHRANKSLSEALLRILDTPISPELVPAASDHNHDEAHDEIGHHTESIIGPYELHDFFIYHYLRNGFDAEKIYVLAQLAFDKKYDKPTIKSTLAIFFKRFYMHQFKRTTLPSGPKVGSVSLSPRGDWRMPDEADVSYILSQIESFS